MNPSMINAVTSMSGLQQKLDILANNMANINTVGYKRQDATFHDILTSHRHQAHGMELSGRLTPLGLTQGWGAKLSMLQTDFAQGTLQSTDLPTDLAVEGNGLIEIGISRLNDNGEVMVDENDVPIIDRTWTRNGAFQLTVQPGDDENAYLATQQGHLLRGTFDEFIRIPKTHSMVVDANGRVFAVDNRVEGALPEQVAQLKIVRIMRPDALQSVGNGMFRLPEGTENIDEILQVVNVPEAEGIAIRQGFLEQSNVNLANEMAELINIQRAYQLNARALSSSDTMMNLANQLRG